MANVEIAWRICAHNITPVFIDETHRLQLLFVLDI